MGRAEMLHTRVDLGAVVRQAQRDVLQAEPERTVEWVIKELPTVSGDPSMLRSFLPTVLSNAFKYSRTREVARIEIGSTEAFGQRVRDLLKDNGVGFDMTYANRCSAFFSGCIARKNSKGRGLGSRTCNGLFCGMAARVGRKRARKGATFYVAPAERETPLIGVTPKFIEC